MAKRYHSIRSQQKMARGKILFVDHFFPPIGRPKCSDPAICNFIETRSTFGTVITIYEGDDEDSMIDLKKVPSDVDGGELEKAARELRRMGININPALLQQVAKEGGADDEQPQKGEDATLESVFPEPVWPQDEPKEEWEIPTKTYLAQANKEQLLVLAARFGVTGVDEETTNANIREALKERFDQLSK